jgi:hypothetical protein
MKTIIASILAALALPAAADPPGYFLATSGWLCPTTALLTTDSRDGTQRAQCLPPPEIARPITIVSVKDDWVWVCDWYRDRCGYVRATQILDADGQPADPAKLAALAAARTRGKVAPGP